VRDWIGQQSDEWVEGIEVATIDAFRGYASAIGEVLPDATLVIDHFHAIRLASTAVSDVRRRVQQDTLGHRGRTGDPLYGIRRLLLRTWANLNDRGWEHLRDGLAPGDPDGQVAVVWLARKLLSEVYTARDLAHAKRPLIMFLPARRRGLRPRAHSACSHRRPLASRDPRLPHHGGAMRN
jgi:transposase